MVEALIIHATGPQHSAGQRPDCELGRKYWLESYDGQLMDAEKI